MRGHLETPGRLSAGKLSGKVRWLCLCHLLLVHQAAEQAQSVMHLTWSHSSSPARFSPPRVPLPPAPTVLQEDVEEDDADFVVSADVRIQKDGDNGSHGVLDFLPLGICAHRQVLEKTHLAGPISDDSLGKW